MSRTFEHFFRDAANRAAVGRALPEGSVVRFDLRVGDQIECWTLKRIEDAVRLVDPRTERADCQLSCTGEDFRALVDGSLDPREGYLSGRLQVTGDVGIVLELRRAVMEP